MVAARRNHPKPDYTKEKIDTQSAFTAPKRTKRKIAEAGKEPSQKKRRTGKTPNSRPGTRSRRRQRQPTPEDNNDDQAQVANLEADVYDAEEPQLPQEPGVEPNLPTPPPPAWRTFFDLPLELRRLIYAHVGTQQIFKPIPGMKPREDDSYNKAIWHSHISPALSALRNKQILYDAQYDALNGKDRALPAAITITWWTQAHLPRFFQMLHESYKLEQRYNAAHVPGTPDGDDQGETLWDKIQRLSTFILDIPVYEFLNPRVFQDFYEKLETWRKNDFSSWHNRKYAYSGPRSISHLSSFERKLLKQFVAMTLVKLRDTNDTPMSRVINVRILLPEYYAGNDLHDPWVYGNHEEFTWRFHVFALFFLYFKFFRTNDWRPIFTLLVRPATLNERSWNQCQTEVADCIEYRKNLVNDPRHAEALAHLDEFEIRFEVASAEEVRQLDEEEERLDSYEEVEV